ncbi:MAG: PAM68 family protein [Geminocystis sp.]|nr:PAM68 family protein [Geminocystis sp.]MCS7147678.1 PAM68 family protein [Geminocystis sp.]MCX8078479.1 PAM68 family protein [Geminocystis sp.]MDW8117233.1 PAM68 family protein [Geminocystis sp.]HIK38614.1 PAM68 family protein [Geminocystis sp. M7585_C2015_104]
MSSPNTKNSLPFEPKSNKKRKAGDKKAGSPTKSQRENVGVAQEKSKHRYNRFTYGIPEVVSKRMVRRMALFSGVPTSMGVLSFFVFYALVSQEWFKVPNTAVLLVTLGLFGLGVLGLSYGIFSASWDEDRVGSWWGWSEFKLNFGRFVSAWREHRQKAVNKD